MLEHVQYWRWAVTQLKRATEPGGRLLVTTRSPGFFYHGHPDDFWRFTELDFHQIFSDLEDVTIRVDESEPGIFLYGRIPSTFVECDLADIHPATCPDPQPRLQRYARRKLGSALARLRRR